MEILMQVETLPNFTYIYNSITNLKNEEKYFTICNFTSIM